MQIILTEEEYNKIKLDRDVIYKEAYKKAKEEIVEIERSYFKELQSLLKSQFYAYQIDGYFIEELETLNKKFRDKF